MVLKFEVREVRTVFRILRHYSTSTETRSLDKLACQKLVDGQIKTQQCCERLIKVPTPKERWQIEIQGIFFARCNYYR